MKFTTSFSLTLYLLTLWVLSLGCSRNDNLPSKLTSLTGDELLQKIHQSSKPYVVVNLFATYCRPCQIELPDLAQINEAPESQAEILFVSIDEPAVIQDKKLAAFLRDLKIEKGSYHMNPDLVDDFVLDYLPNWNSQIPLNLVFTRDGRLVQSTGMTDQHEISMIVLKDQSFH